MTADPAFQKLTNLMGPTKANEVYSDTLRRIGVSSLATPTDRYRFAIELMKHGGVLEHVGRAIKIQAILLGAKES